MTMLALASPSLPEPARWPTPSKAGKAKKTGKPGTK
jgi:hypothetical protein